MVFGYWKEVKLEEMNGREKEEEEDEQDDEQEEEEEEAKLSYRCSRCLNPLGERWTPEALCQEEYTLLKERASNILYPGLNGKDMYVPFHSYSVLGADCWSLYRVYLLLYCNLCTDLLKAYKRKVANYLMRLCDPHTEAVWSSRLVVKMLARLTHPWMELIKISPHSQVLNMKHICDPRNPLVYLVNPVWADDDSKTFSLPSSWKMYFRPLHNDQPRPNCIHSFVRLKHMLSYIWHATIQLSISPNSDAQMEASQVVYSGTNRMPNYEKVDKSLSPIDKNRVRNAIERIDTALAQVMTADEKGIQNECEIFCVLDPGTTPLSYQLRIIIYHRVRTSLLSVEHKQDLSKLAPNWTPEMFTAHEATSQLMNEHKMLTNALLQASKDGQANRSDFIITAHTETLCPLMYSEDVTFHELDTFAATEHCAYHKMTKLTESQVQFKCLNVNAFSGATQRVGLVDIKKRLADQVGWPRVPYFVDMTRNCDELMTPVLLEGEDAGEVLKRIEQDFSDRLSVQIPEQVKKYWHTRLDPVVKGKSWY